MKKHIWKIIFGLAIALVGASFIYAQYIGTKANEGVVLSDHVKGNSEASVTLTEYGDFQCPACAQFSPIVKEVVDQYGDQIAFEFRHFPLISIHPYAVPAAKAAEAAGVQGKFFEMHDKLYENQSAWAKSPAPQAFFIQYAEELGLDIALFKQHMRASLIEEKIESQFKEAQERGLTGTPTFFLNGERLEFKTMEEFFGAIEGALGITAPTATATPAASDAVEFGLPVQPQ